MKYLILLSFILTSCGMIADSWDGTTQIPKGLKDYSSIEYKQYCNNKCQKRFNTDVSWIGQYSGQCYCK